MSGNDEYKHGCCASERRCDPGCCSDEAEMNAMETDAVSGSDVQGCENCCSDPYGGASCCGGHECAAEDSNDTNFSGCSGGCCNAVTIDRKIEIQYLYLDLASCQRCMGTDEILSGIIQQIKPAFEMGGFTIEYAKIQIENEEMAKNYRFESSPTIRVNGSDIMMKVKENSCGCCSDISNTDVNCRVFEFDGIDYEVPPTRMLRKAIVDAILHAEQDDKFQSEYVLPENLKKFFDGKSKINSCDCCNE